MNQRNRAIDQAVPQARIDRCRRNPRLGQYIDAELLTIDARRLVRKISRRCRVDCEKRRQTLPKSPQIKELSPMISVKTAVAIRASSIAMLFVVGLVQLCVLSKDSRHAS